VGVFTIMVINASTLLRKFDIAYFDEHPNCAANVVLSSSLSMLDVVEINFYFTDFQTPRHTSLVRERAVPRCHAQPVVVVVVSCRRPRLTHFKTNLVGVVVVVVSLRLRRRPPP
jgi:hypothetical protein